MTSNHKKPNSPDSNQPSTTIGSGYGKPPKKTQFQKGKSGNPRGRPKKVKPDTDVPFDASIDELFEREGQQRIRLLENGKEIEVTKKQAVVKRSYADAVKGSRITQQNLIKRTRKLEKKKLKKKIKRYFRYLHLKIDGEEILADCKLRNVAPPELIPHPGDIFLSDESWDFFIDGPLTDAEARKHKYSLRLRGFLFRVALETHGIGGLATIGKEGGTVAVGYQLALSIDEGLPQRYRWSNMDMAHLVDDYSIGRKRERNKAIATERKWLLDNLQRQHPDIASEEEMIFQMVVEALLAHGKAPRRDGTVFMPAAFVTHYPNVPADDAYSV